MQMRKSNPCRTLVVFGCHTVGGGGGRDVHAPFLCCSLRGRVVVYALAPLFIFCLQFCSSIPFEPWSVQKIYTECSGTCLAAQRPCHTTLRVQLLLLLYSYGHQLVPRYEIEYTYL